MEDKEECMIYDADNNLWYEEEWKKQISKHPSILFDFHKLLFRSTIKIVEDGRYLTSSGKEVVLNDDPDLSSNLYSKELFVEKKSAYATNIYVVNEDCLALARDLVVNEDEVAILNMCSYKSPGGSVWNGKCGQEEYLVNCSNYYKELFRYGSMAEMYGLVSAKSKYPLDLRYGGIFTRNVTVFRDSSEAGYRLLDNPFKVNIIGVPAISSPSTILIDNELRIVEVDRNVVKDKIRTIFNIAIEQGIHTLILGAWGCGGYRNPPKHIAELFREILNEYSGVFKNVFFAIKDTFVQGNFIIFRDVLTKRTYGDISKLKLIDVPEKCNLKFDLRKLVGHVAENWVLGELHGLKHWKQVHANVLRLCTVNEGVNIDIAVAFAYLHDSCRRYNGRDLMHGERAVDNVLSIRHSILREFSDDEIRMLCEACKFHSQKIKTGNITIDTCFDADRLDLIRVDIEPVVEKMATDGGRMFANNCSAIFTLT